MKNSPKSRLEIQSNIDKELSSPAKVSIIFQTTKKNRKKMIPKEFQALIKAKSKEFETAINRRLPILVGRKATDFFKGNFRQGGFVNNGLHPWKKTLRQMLGRKNAKSQYGPLLSERNNLYGSIRYVPGEARVVVGTTLHYAAIHNWGGTIIQHRTVKNNKKRTKGKGSKVNWKALDITQRQTTTVTIHMPQRQFIGPSKELNDMVNETIDKEFTRILKS